MRTTLVLGGARSGKSRHAEALVRGCPGPWTYIATAEAGDAEMRARIERHRAERGEDWITIEEPLNLAEAILRAGPGAVLVECLTLWLSNLMMAEADPIAATGALLAALDRSPARIVLVSNEVGLGLVPATPLGRAFRDEAGRLNQRVAAAVDTVLFIVAGLPLTVKSGCGGASA